MQMSTRRHIRELALQALYQLDARGDEDIAEVERSVMDDSDDQEAKGQAWELAWAAWTDRQQTDRLLGELARDWPVDRQAPVDRSILRLAYHEMLAATAPDAVVINEAVELAKTFSTERSGAFINGLLDQMRKQLRQDQAEAVGPDESGSGPSEAGT